MTNPDGAPVRSGSDGERPAAGTGVEASFRLRRGGFNLDLGLVLPPVGITGLFGPSGAGKTTVLRCLAGLEPGAEGTVVVGGRTWQDHGTFVPPHRRGVGVVFQEADLFPHLDVVGNLQYGLRRRRGDDGEIGLDDVVEWLGLGRLLARDPRGLSGGERQRVALGRALLAGPRLLLMDEPLAALDEPTRREIFPYLRTLRDRLRIPVVYVSHALLETARLVDRMVWLVDGRVRAEGPVQEVLAGTAFARWQGDRAGVVVDAQVREHDDDFHLTRLEGPWGPIWVRRQRGAPGAHVRLELLAGDVTLGLAPDRDSSVLNQFEVTVREVAEGEPGEALVRLGRGPGGGPDLLARVTTRSSRALGLEPGRAVWARVKSVAVLD